VSKRLKNSAKRLKIFEDFGVLRYPLAHLIDFCGEAKINQKSEILISKFETYWGQRSSHFLVFNVRFGG
jgi:hypothetical protein